MKISLLIVCLLAAGSQTAASGELVRITSGEYPPWTSADLQHGGFTNHVIKEAFALEGYETEFTFYPWKRAYETAKKGEQFRATSYWYPSEHRQKDFYYSDPLQEDAVVFFHLKSDPPPDWETLEDLRGLKIGATESFTYTDEFWAAREAGTLDVEVAPSEELNFRKLLKGRIHLYPSSPLVARRLLLDKFGRAASELLTYHPKPLTAPTGHLLFSKNGENAEALLAAFNRGLAKLRANGRYTLLQKEWIAGTYNRR